VPPDPPDPPEPPEPPDPEPLPEPEGELLAVPPPQASRTDVKKNKHRYASRFQGERGLGDIVSVFFRVTALLPSGQSKAKHESRTCPAVTVRTLCCVPYALAANHEGSRRTLSCYSCTRETAGCGWSYL